MSGIASGLDREATPPDAGLLPDAHGRQLDHEADEQSAVDAVAEIANRAMHERNRHHNALLDIKLFAESVSRDQLPMTTAYAVAQIILGKIDAALGSQR